MFFCRQTVVTDGKGNKRYLVVEDIEHNKMVLDRWGDLIYPEMFDQVSEHATIVDGHLQIEADGKIVSTADYREYRNLYTKDIVDEDYDLTQELAYVMNEVINEVSSKTEIDYYDEDDRTDSNQDIIPDNRENVTVLHTKLFYNDIDNLTRNYDNLYDIAAGHILGCLLERSHVSIHIFA